MKFLLEFASEEIPARMQAAAVEQLRTRFVDGCKAAGLAHGAVTADVTPRRLWLIAENVAPDSAATREERKGPAASAPEAAIAGFLRSTGQTRDQLEERVTPKGVVLFAHIDTPGREAAAILAELMPAIVVAFQWPKSMRWGAASTAAGSPRWVRPLTGIIALLGSDVVPCAAFGIASGRATRGHRIHAPEPVEIADADSYAAQLRDAHIIVASSERRALIEAGAAALAAAQGLTVITDAGLVAENAGLTEWPVPMLGRFDAAFLTVPREVIQLTMRTNQKYFALADGEGALAPVFVCVANLVANDGGAAIIAGNERVLSARLADAKFFWDQDLRAGIESFVPKLSQIVFHEKLGTVADKVDRVAKLARWLILNAITSPLEREVGLGAAEQGEGASITDNPSPRSPSARRSLPQGEREALADLAEQAARLCKADLVSATVSEFPEVQGIAGAYLARATGLDPRIADAIRDHYKPVGQGDEIPTAPVSVAVALADKLDTLCAFFAIGELPTGSRDPFALRRAALGVLAVLFENNIRLKAHELFTELAGDYFPSSLAIRHKDVPNLDDFRPDFDDKFWMSYEQLLPFLIDRLKVQQRDSGVRQDLIDAVFALGSEDDLVLLIARVRALQSVLATDHGTNLLAGVKRAANILRIEESKGETFAPKCDAALLFETDESTLAIFLDTAVPTIVASLESENFTAAMTALASLRPAIDAFFDTVIVNAPDPLVRANRLGLLARVRDAANSVADFSRIEG